MIPDNLPADELLFQYGERLSTASREWLCAFITLWEYAERHNQNTEPLVDYYDHWIATTKASGRKSDAEFRGML